MSAEQAASGGELLSPAQRYEQLLDAGALTADPAQREAIDALDAIYTQLCARAPRVPLWATALRWLGRPPPRPPVRGLYLWGDVGRGKTFLVDLFFDCLAHRDNGGHPDLHGRRVHFHRFMREVHRQLRNEPREQNPLQRIARRIAARTRVLCLDEFFVADIADAMLLHGLLDGLFSHGVTLITTSNTPPDALYRDGLQRARFLPAIALLKQHTRVLALKGDTDYRLRTLEQAELYHTPLDKAADRILADCFGELAPESGADNVALDVEGRTITALKAADGVAWFDFGELCDGPRSQNDYLELARCFHTILLSNIPVFDWRQDNQARRFIHLVDVLYDHNVNLIVSAAAEPRELYQGKRLGFEFQRTVSRLLEMQSHEYLGGAHKG